MKDAVPINKYYCCLRDVFSLFSKKYFLISFILSFAVLTFSYLRLYHENLHHMACLIAYTFYSDATRWLWMNCNCSIALVIVVPESHCLCKPVLKCQTILRYTKVYSRLQFCKFQSWIFIGCNLRILLKGFCNGISLQFGAQHWIYLCTGDPYYGLYTTLLIS